MLSKSSVKVEVLFWEGCPSYPKAIERLRKVFEELGIDYELELIRVESEEDAQRFEFPGSPTIRINGEDIQPEMAKPPYSLSCRLYIIEGRYLPVPTEDYIKRRVKEILKL
jgi:hypothetical protein